MEFLLRSVITHSTALVFLDGQILLARQVCRYCQQQPEKSICYGCQTSENLWMCVICGFVGCGRYKDGHAISHWKETQHCYSLELETQRVWDYAGDNYVHRLIQSKTDGKLVELNRHCLPNDDGCGDCTGYSDTLLDSEVEAIVNEYNELLTSQLENQKNVKLEKCIEEKKFLDDINDNLLRNKGIWESKIADIEEREKKLLKLKDKKVEELEELLRIMMAYLETDNSEHQNTEQQSTPSNELKDENVLPLDTELSPKNGSRGGHKND